MLESGSTGLGLGGCRISVPSSLPHAGQVDEQEHPGGSSLGMAGVPGAREPCPQGGGKWGTPRGCGVLWSGSCACSLQAWMCIPVSQPGTGGEPWGMLRGSTHQGGTEAALLVAARTHSRTPSEATGTDRSRNSHSHFFHGFFFPINIKILPCSLAVIGAVLSSAPRPVPAPCAPVLVGFPADPGGVVLPNTPKLQGSPDPA